METNFKFFYGILVIPMVVVLLLFSGDVWSQTTGKITGQVTDEAGELLPGANITIEGTTIGAATGIDGNYVILNVPPGLYSVKASMIGYTNVVQTEVRVKFGMTTELNYNLKEEAIAGETITVVSERPIIEVDLTASKQVMTGAEITDSWVQSAEDALLVQSGVNVHGGVRGGFGLDMYYNVDGLGIRDASNKSWVKLNTTAIQELEVLTGGFNAEYGSANSAVVNVITRQTSSQLHGNIRARFRPAGEYHWGGNMFSSERWEKAQFDALGNPAAGNVDFWDPAKGGKDGSVAPFTGWTPQQRLDYWLALIDNDKVLTEYADRAQWEFEGTFTGPLPIAPNLGFMVSGRYKRGVLEYPSALDYHPEWNILAKINYDVTGNTKIVLSGMYAGTDNGGPYQIPAFGTSEETNTSTGNPVGFYTSAYESGKYWPFGAYGYGGGTTLGRVKPPEYIDVYAASARATHVFNPSTFIEVMYSFQQTNREATFRRVARTFLDENGNNIPYEFQGVVVAPASALGNGFFVNWGEPTGRLEGFSDFWEHSVKVDFTSQLHPAHQFKAGGSFSYHEFERQGINANVGSGARVTWLDAGPDQRPNPWEFSLYAQDKIEILGMVVNAGLRMDMFNANSVYGSSIWDPLQTSTWTLGHPLGLTPGIIAFDKNSEFVEKAPTQVVLSPRIGISHPITDNTVLHFMYGHFNQRPGWAKIVSTGSVDFTDPNLDHSTRPDYRFESAFVPVRYDGEVNRFNNPWLDFERIIQYEVGFDQNIADVIRFDATLYFKDGKRLTTTGLKTGGRDVQGGLGTDFTVPNANLRGRPDDGGVGTVEVAINGGTIQSRGVEFTADTRFIRNAQFSLTFNASFLNSDKYGPNDFYINIPGQEVRGQTNFHGGNNSDEGRQGNDNERFNPNYNFKLNATVTSPRNFGPSWGRFRVLADWTVNWYTSWSSGQPFTWHAPGDFSTETDNLRWKTRSFTNLRLARAIRLGTGLNARLSVDVINLFDQHQLRLFGSANMDQFQLTGVLPFQSTTGEPLEWEWYQLQLLPRKIIFGLGFEF